ncbi:MAG: 7-cyano-7-deazaguanine synthase QueC [Alphaproteobacteria bacterium]|nr:7-cyano-7-deazaguanine synthase QueC [Alphaproteobacteria bacterium]
MTERKKALVLFSGGQDSATCLAWALDAFDEVETVGFAYGQRHAVELECRDRFAVKLRARFAQWAVKMGGDHTLDLSLIQALGETALTSDSEIAMGKNGLPTTFVPGRNILFFTAAAALACRRGIKHLVGGMCETDYSGYPDCRDDTLKSLQVSLNLGLDARFVIETPLMWRDKAATWAMAYELGGQALVDLIVEETHSCYRGDRTQRHAWGYGCGACPACELRANGWDRYKAAG